MNNLHRVLFSASVYVICIVLCAASYLYNYIESPLVIDVRHDRFMTLVSFLYFIVLTVLGVTSSKRFWFLLPFVIFTVPNAVNSLFPGFYLGPASDKNNASFSFISHIDIYFLAYFCAKVLSRKKLFQEGRCLTLISWMTFFLGLSLVINSVYSIVHNSDYVYILNGAFHFRYLFLLSLVVVDLYREDLLKAFIRGIAFSLPLLIVESLVYTLITGERLFGSLLSGNFANNVYGNMAAFLFVLFAGLEYSKRRSIKIPLAKFTATTSLALVAFTGVRGAMLSSFVGMISMFLVIRVKLLTLFLLFIVCSIGCLLVIELLNLWWMFDYLVTLLNSIQIVIESGYGSDGIEIDSTNSSLITRIAIWKATLAMIVENPVLGIGTGAWNYLKGEYGIPFRVLLDPHNEYLNYFVTYGVIPGGFVLFNFYVLPLIYLIKSKIVDRDINPFYIALTILAISGLTNANTSKHQMFMLVALIFSAGVIYSNKLRALPCTDMKQPD